MPLLRRRRPLLRAAAVGGGAYMMGKSVGNRQSQEVAPQEPESQPQAAPAAAPPSAGGISDESLKRLRELGDLHDQGVLTDDEFADQKQRVLNG